MKKIDLAPILILTLNRYEHFKRCVTSLAMCKNAEDSVLYIALDYPLKESHWEGYKQICEYLPKIFGFKEVTVIKRDTNFGPNKNFEAASELLFEKYPYLIFTEDDNIFSPDFLDFVNNGLKIYKERKDIFSISGYQYPLDIPSNYNLDIYLWQGYSAWGVGIWRDKWKKVSLEKDKALTNIRNFFKSYKDIYNYYKVANHYIPALLFMIEKNRIHGDGYICLHQFSNNMYSVFPVISRVRNMGHDGSGTGCGYMENDIYAQQEIYFGEVGKSKMPICLQSNNDINKVLAQHFGIPFKLKIIIFIKTILLNTFLWPYK